MDKEGERKKLEDAAAFVAAYKNHAITQQFDRDDTDREAFLLHVICDEPIQDVPSFFVHFQAVGELQGLRRRKAMLPAQLEEIQEKIKEL